MVNTLNVWDGNKLIGEIATDQGRWHFQYHAKWLTDSCGYALSPHLVLQQQPFIDSANNKSVEWFFENLLPEGGIREALARALSISKNDAYGLLARYGQESAGALSILPAGSKPQAGEYIELSLGDLQQRISRSSEIPLLHSSDELHMSLAGVQNKLGVLYKDSRFYLPTENAASSHIIKPENLSTNFSFCPANEFFCMRLAEAVGLPVPSVGLVHIPNAIFIIERFDRVITNETVERQHQIDLCQLLNKWAGYKYESHGGITTKELFDSLNQLSKPAIAREKILQWILFNFIIGNTDAHAKNISFNVTNNTIQLAPFYDLVCVQAYLPESTMAMSIFDENRYGWIDKQHWNALALEASVPKSLIYSYIERLRKKINQQLNTIMMFDEFTNQESQFIQHKVLAVIKKQLDYLTFKN